MKCIILVGGSGQRLWPLSRDLYPKQLLKIKGAKNFLQNAYKLANLITANKNIISITNVKHLSDTELQLKELCKEPIIISEPASKNTAAAAASVLTFLQSTADEILVFLPCDFTVEDTEEFLTAIKKAKSLASDGYICAIGTKPLFAETGYGYIKAGTTIKKGRKIEQFKEKPSLDKAKKYLKDGNYFWNCGIYVTKASVLREAFSKYAPEIISGMNIDMFDQYNKIDYLYYDNIPPISIDYAVIEKAENLAMVELETNWYDFGSWKSVYDNSEKDSKGNVIRGNVITSRVKNSFIHSSKELVAVADINNTVVIETEDAILVCSQKETQNINKIVNILRENKSTLVDSHKTVFRPWGFYTCLNSGDGWLSKIITVSPGHKLSVQSHNHRSEHWVVLEGTATVILENQQYELSKRQSIDIPRKAKHSLQNRSETPLKILEVQKGDYISEDDIIRYEDMYGRIK